MKVDSLKRIWNPKFKIRAWFTALLTAVVTVYATNGSSEQWAYVFNAYKDASPQGKFNMIRGAFSSMVGHVDKPEYAQQGITAIKEFGIGFKQFGIAPPIIGVLNDIKAQRTKLNDTASAQAADDAIKAINDAK